MYLAESRVKSQGRILSRSGFRTSNLSWAMTKRGLPNEAPDSQTVRSCDS